MNVDIYINGGAILRDAANGGYKAAVHGNRRETDRRDLAAVAIA